VLDNDYQLEHSESNTGTVYQETAVEEYQYCTSLQRAFKSLLFTFFIYFIIAYCFLTLIQQCTFEYWGVLELMHL